VCWVSSLLQLMSARPLAICPSVHAFVACLLIQLDSDLPLPVRWVPWALAADCFGVPRGSQAAWQSVDRPLPRAGSGHSGVLAVC
jgi:hypothetical protein